MKERYSAKSTAKIREYLKEEAECLNKLLLANGNNKKHEEDTDSISAELEELYQEKIFLQEQNKTLVNRYIGNERLLNNKKNSLSMKVKNKSENKKIIVQRSKSSHLLSDVGKESKNVQLDYLEKVILKLEKVQTAESLKCIVDTRKCTEVIEKFMKLILIELGNRFWRI